MIGLLAAAATALGPQNALESTLAASDEVWLVYYTGIHSAAVLEADIEDAWEYGVTVRCPSRRCSTRLPSVMRHFHGYAISSQPCEDAVRARIVFRREGQEIGRALIMRGGPCVRFGGETYRGSGDDDLLTMLKTQPPIDW